MKRLFTIGVGIMSCATWWYAPEIVDALGFGLSRSDGALDLMGRENMKMMGFLFAAAVFYSIILGPIISAFFPSKRS